MTKPVPAGFHTLTPHIVVGDGAKAIAFYKQAFGAEEQTRLQMPGTETLCTPSCRSAIP